MSRQTVPFSGGRDPAAVPPMMPGRGEQVDGAFFLDGGREFPETYGHVSPVEGRTGIRIAGAYPPRPFDHHMFDHVEVEGRHRGERGHGRPFPHVGRCTGIERDRLDGESRSGDVRCVGPAEGEERRARTGKRYPPIGRGVAGDEAPSHRRDPGYGRGGPYDGYDGPSCRCRPCRSLKDPRDPYGMRPGMRDRLEGTGGRPMDDLRYRYSPGELGERLGGEVAI